MKNEKQITVLSLFDGISTGQLALQQLGLTNYLYYASEIHKHSMDVVKKHFPATVQLGDVTKLDASKLGPVDLLIGGSPCQGFSIAGNGLNFEDPRSKLFFEFVRIKEQVNPTYWMLENVKMPKSIEAVINKTLGVIPVEIDASRVSGQSRKRLFWTNLPIKQPGNKFVRLQDVLESGLALRDKSQTILATLYKENAKSMIKRNKTGLLVMEPSGVTAAGNGVLHFPEGSAPVSPKYKAQQGEKIGYRKLSPLECERLQSLPDNYTAGASSQQRYIMVGNGWNTEVIKHIFRKIPFIKNNL